MTDLALDLDLDQTAASGRGVVGGRQLVAVQTFEIARLTSHPVVLVPGTFVAVTGRGPRQDSNESGKTSFLAAVSLLLGDPEWRLTAGTGGAAAAQLLFEPEVAGVAAQRFRAATHGYVVGVFAERDDPVGTALTVWCRIGASTPYLQVRWTDGVHVADGETDQARHAQADDLWKAIGSRDELGPRHYVHMLYGDAPRCLAYVARRGSLRSTPSLLQMDAGAFSPEQIGPALIALTGRAVAFDTEAEQRRKLAAAEEGIAARQAEAAQAAAEEEQNLAAVGARDAARLQLVEAAEAWRLHYARGYLDVLGQAAALDGQVAAARPELAADEDAVSAAHEVVDRLTAQTDLDDLVESAEKAAGDLRTSLDRAQDDETAARARLADLRARRDARQRLADGWRGPDVAACAAALARAETERRAADVAMDRGQERRDAADADLQAVLGGGGGATGRLRDRLAAADIEAAVVLDTVTIEDHPGARAFWEPRLSLYRDAVVVTATDLGRAIIVAPPGAVLVAGASDLGPSLPQGIAAAPTSVRLFLAALAGRGDDAGAPPGVTDALLGVTVVGGFVDPIAGRDARVAAAQVEFARLEGQLAMARRAAAAAGDRWQQARDDLSRAQASADAVGLGIEITANEATRSAADRRIQDLTARWQAADRERVQTTARQANHHAAIQIAEAAVASTERQRDETAAAVRDLEERRRRLAVDYWAQGWTDDADAARAALRDDRRAENTLRRAASEALLVALTGLGIGPDGAAAPTPEIAAVAARRGALSEEPNTVRAAPNFAQATAPLQDWLDAYHDGDRITEDTITRLRTERRRNLETLERECAELRGALASIQDAIEQRITQSLESISSALDRLDRRADGFGAELQADSLRPDGPRATWRWRVTPRWRRADGGPLVRYDNQSNSAREKLFTVHLVLAALLAAPNPQGRVLVLDEMGDSLGVTHRRDVFRAIAETAKEKGVTVLGTCQDSVIADATSVCGEVLYFSYPARSEALNHPTRMFGFDADRNRVELTADALRAGRPPV